MIENIWRKVLDRVEAEPSKLEMNSYFCNLDGTVRPSRVSPDFLSVCGTAACIHGHAYIIALQENEDGVPSFDDDEVLFPYLYGEECGDFTDRGSLWWKLHNYNNKQGLSFLRNRAMRPDDFIRKHPNACIDGQEEISCYVTMEDWWDDTTRGDFQCWALQYEFPDLNVHEQLEELLVEVNKEMVKEGLSIVESGTQEELLNYYYNFAMYNMRHRNWADLVRRVIDNPFRSA